MPELFLSDDALDAAVRTLHPVVIRRAAQLVPRQDAEDVAQIVWLRVYQHRAAFRGECALSSWVYLITTRTAIDYLRWRKRLHVDEAANLEPFADVLTDQAPSPYDRARVRELGRALSRQILRLAPEYRSAIRLVGLQQLTRAEAAAVLRVPLNTTKTRAHRARRQLAARSGSGC